MITDERAREISGGIKRAASELEHRVAVARKEGLRVDVVINDVGIATFGRPNRVATRILVATFKEVKSC